MKFQDNCGLHPDASRNNTGRVEINKTMLGLTKGMLRENPDTTADDVRKYFGFHSIDQAQFYIDAAKQ